jgi:hypothetical protein
MRFSWGLVPIAAALTASTTSNVQADPPVVWRVDLQGTAPALVRPIATPYEAAPPWRVDFMGTAPALRKPVR